MIDILSTWSLVKLMLVNILILGCVRCDINWNGNNWALACDFFDNNLSNARIASNLCSERCAQTSECTHYTWTKYSDGTCWMKYGGVSKSDAVYTNDTTMICGILDTVIQSGIQWNANNSAFGCYFRGNDMSNVLIASNLCAGQCAQTSGCSHFVWTTYMGGTCWMKSGVVSESNATHTGEPSMLCGIINASSIAAVAGTTTSFGDSCTPGCGVEG
ncbi:unnamed protein product [Rotaria sordida]|uniref:Apple domain-containing protein n=1 Tax=Rotaria sordida TaxID=392033 RepID=A0A815PQJ4_9BILA|nr:unnamed protein product [Rotaria sordida]CAF1452536.1 unnamed protein product [Rotaria sordida]